MKKILKKHYKKGFAEMSNLQNNIDIEINRQLARLDDAFHKHEITWGIGRIDSLVGKDMSDKWDRQKQKLADALEKRNVAAVYDLVDGCLRGIKAMESMAKERGHKPNDCEYWETTHPDTGELFRVCKSNIDTSKLAHLEGHTFTLEQAIRVLADNTLEAVTAKRQNEKPKSLMIGEFYEDKVPF